MDSFIHCPKQQNTTRGTNSIPAHVSHPVPVPDPLCLPVSFLLVAGAAPPLPPHPQESQPASQPGIIPFSARRPDAAARPRRCPSTPTPAPLRPDSARLRFGYRHRRRRSGEGSHQPAVHAARDGVPLRRGTPASPRPKHWVP